MCALDSVEDCLGLLASALAPLGAEGAAELSPILHGLLEVAFEDLKRAEVANPMEHHLIVLGHMMAIARAESFSAADIKRAAALALLHDISAVPKITTQMVEEARRRDPAEANALELRRQQNRILHMREGSAMAHRALLDLNERLGGVVFDAQDIDVVCELIRIHDGPSLNVPIPRRNWMAVAFREADRLWMLTPEGIRVDLVRKNKNPDDPRLCREQLEKNVRRFREERCLYHASEPTEGPFCDDETFFRTRKGHAIFRRLYKLGKLQYAC